MTHKPLCPAQVLSSMVTAPGAFLQRCSVSLRSGEHMTLTFELRLEDSLQPSYRGFRVRTSLVQPCGSCTLRLVCAC